MKNHHRQNAEIALDRFQESKSPAHMITIHKQSLRARHGSANK